MWGSLGVCKWVYVCVRLCVSLTLKVMCAYIWVTARYLSNWVCVNLCVCQSVISMFACMHIYVCVCVLNVNLGYVCIWVCVCVWWYMPIFKCVCVCLCVCVCVGDIYLCVCPGVFQFSLTSTAFNPPSLGSACLTAIALDVGRYPRR